MSPMERKDRSPLSPRRIVILFHTEDRRYDPNRFIVGHLARFWREDGHEVVSLFGTETHVPGDIVLVHVDLSIVPDPYLRFAARYPRVLNGGIRDIRKSTISGHLLRADDPWPGRVIVKSDLNCAGLSERALEQGWLARRVELWRRAVALGARWTGRTPTFSDWREYQVYERLADVPRRYFARRDVVVERFLPEFEDGLYRLRVYQFLGDRHVCTRLASPDPVLKSYSSVLVETVDPAPETMSWRRQLNMDYGHFDYVMHDGKAILLDANKTTGASNHVASDELIATRRQLAQGLYSYFD